MLLTKSRLDLFRTRDSLPQVFIDAVNLTLRLEVHYIWIDSLCIIQDGQKDWQRGAAAMSAIFQNSGLAISTTKSRNSNDSIF